MRKIKIGDESYLIDDSAKAKDMLFEKLVDWMGEKTHSAAHSGEGIMQDDDCLIDSSELISEMVDDVLKPKHSNK